VIGNEIIEAPMAQRARYFEFRAYRSLLKDYFARGARWSTAPKPLMSEALYRQRGPGGERFDFASGPLLTEFEPAFDTACFARFGRDLFWQPDLVSNEFGVEWLRRHLGPTFQIHRIAFREPTPTHIDTTLVPVRPGLVLINPERPCTNGALDRFAANGWRVVPAPPSVRTGRAQASTKASICRHPRRLKYPTQKSARSEILSESDKAGRSDKAMLSKIRGMKRSQAVRLTNDTRLSQWRR